MAKSDWNSHNLSTDEVIKHIDEQLALGERQPNPSEIRIDCWVSHYITAYQQLPEYREALQRNAPVTAYPEPIGSELYLHWFAGNLGSGD